VNTAMRVMPGSEARPGPTPRSHANAENTMLFGCAGGDRRTQVALPGTRCRGLESAA
jgi:hypothetical protein